MGRHEATWAPRDTWGFMGTLWDPIWGGMEAHGDPMETHWHPIESHIEYGLMGPKQPMNTSSGPIGSHGGPCAPNGIHWLMDKVRWILPIFRRRRSALDRNRRATVRLLVPVAEADAAASEPESTGYAMLSLLHAVSHGMPLLESTAPFGALGQSR